MSQPSDQARPLTPSWFTRTYHWSRGKVREARWQTFLKNVFLVSLAFSLAAVLYLQLLPPAKPSVDPAPREARVNGTSWENLFDSAVTQTGSAPVTTKKEYNPAHDPYEYQVSSRSAPLPANWTKSAAQQLNEKAHLDHKAVPLWCWALLPAGILALIIALSERKRTVAKELTERDPPELRLLFEKYEDRIKALGTPRKVKRFSGKIRLQYHHLLSGGVLQAADGDSARLSPKTELFFFMLLIMDNDRLQWLSTGRADFAEKLVGVLLKGDVAQAGWDNRDLNIANSQSLLSHVYELNKGVII